MLTVLLLLFHLPSVVTIIAVPSAGVCSSAAATAALLRLLRPVAAAAPVAAGCFLMSVMHPTMEVPAGAACRAGVIKDVAMVLPLLRVMLG